MIKEIIEHKLNPDGTPSGLKKRVKKYIQDEKLNVKAVREEGVNLLTVSVPRAGSDDLIFHADPEARLNMLAAIEAANFKGLSETLWRLQGNKTPVIISLAELREASYLALVEFGNIIGIV